MPNGTRKRDAYKEGRQLGFDIVQENLHEMSPEEVENAAGYAHGVYYDHTCQFDTECDRAAQYNAAGNPEAVWEGFDAGLSIGARKAAQGLPVDA
jgi:hypothetical protein